jgi:hypothetical protein
MAAKSKGIDYSKWDAMDVSEDDKSNDEEDEADDPEISSLSQAEADSEAAIRQLLAKMPKRDNEVHVSTPKPFPDDVTAQNIIQAIRNSCDGLLAISRHACRIDLEACKVLAEEIREKDLDLEKWFRTQNAYLPPLKFPSIDAHINFWCIHTLLSFGSGFSRLLQNRETDLSDVLLRGCVGLFLMDSKLDSALMRRVTITDVSNSFSLPLSESVPMTGAAAAITMDRAHPLRPLADSILQVLFETGVLLHQAGCNGFADFVRKHGNGSASAFVFALGSTFPAFGDHARVAIPLHAVAAGDTIAPPAPPASFHHTLFLSKAQTLAWILQVRFSANEPALNFSDIHTLTAAVEHRLPAVLTALGVLKPSLHLKSLVSHHSDFEPGTMDESLLRAAALIACDRISEALNPDGSGAPLSSHVLGNFLIRAWKPAELDKASSHICLKTKFY